MTSVRETVEAMRKEGHGCILICDGPKLLGIFTERDLIKKVQHPKAELDQPILEFMTLKPATVRQNHSIGAAIRIMHEGHYRHLPIVDENEVPIGILSVKNIVQHIVDHFPAAVYNLPPQTGQIKFSREGA